jgi:hypothetical protein
MDFIAAILFFWFAYSVGLTGIAFWAVQAMAVAELVRATVKIVRRLKSPHELPAMQVADKRQ